MNYTKTVLLCITAGVFWPTHKVKLNKGKPIEHWGDLQPEPPNAIHKQKLHRHQVRLQRAGPTPVSPEVHVYARVSKIRPGLPVHLRYQSLLFQSHYCPALIQPYIRKRTVYMSELQNSVSPVKGLQLTVYTGLHILI